MKKLIIASVIALCLPTTGCAGVELVDQDFQFGDDGLSFVESDSGHEISDGSAGDSERCTQTDGTLAYCDTTDGGGSGGSDGGSGGSDGGSGGSDGGSGGSDAGSGGGDNEGAGGGGDCERTPPKVTCYVVEGNPTCDDENLGTTLIRIDPVTTGLHFTPDISVDVDTDGTAFQFASDTGVTAVIIKGGPKAMVCVYDGIVTSDSDLVAADNESSGQTYGLSHVDLCRATSQSPVDE